MITAEVAALLGVSESRVRHMVREGKLHPLVPGSHPLTFDEAAVIEWEYRHRRKRDSVTHLAQRWQILAS